MKKLAIILTSVVAFLMNTLSANLIQEYILDENTIFSIPTHPMTTVTIQFPGEIEGLKGAGFMGETEGNEIDFVCSYTPGDAHFSLIPSSSDVISRNLNVIINGGIYVLKPYVVDDPNQACAIVKFKNKSIANLKDDTTSAIEKKAYILKKDERPTINQFISMIDLLKTTGSLDNVSAKAVMQKFPQVEYKEIAECQLDYGIYSIHLKSVMRNQSIDAVGFCFVIENQSNKDLVVDPESLSVRVGNHIYHQVISDLQPLIKSGDSAIGYFIIHGDGEGRKNYLGVNNQFTISLDLIGPTEDENI